MLSGPGLTEYAELKQVIHSVRNRWRMRIVLRGLAIIGAGGLAAFLISTFIIDQFRYSAGALLAFRLLTLVVLALLTIRFLVLPLMNRISD